VASTGRGEWGRTAAWAAVFLVAGFLGRATRFDEPPIAFVWPAAGVWILWLVLAPPRRRVVVELTVLAVAAYVVNRVTGAPPTLALVFVFANVVNAWAGALVYLRVSRSPRDQLKDTHGLLALGAGALAGALASAPLSVAVLLTQGQDPAATTAAVWVSRYAASSAVVMAVVLAWRGWSADRRSGAAVGRAPAPAELVALLAVSLLVHGAVFLVNVGESYAFLALPVTVLVGWRAGPAWTATHGLLTASFGVAATLAGRGPFALLEPAALQTVVVQAFIAVTCLVGLALALEVRQRHLAWTHSNGRATAPSSARLRSRWDRTVPGRCGTPTPRCDAGGVTAGTGRRSRDVPGSTWSRPRTWRRAGGS
jgi:hypothetical protein